MIADTLITNRAMQRLAARAGFTIRASREDATLARLEKALGGPVGTPSTRPRAA